MWSDGLIAASSLVALLIAPFELDVLMTFNAPGYWTGLICNESHLKLSLIAKKVYCALNITQTL
jgi:hypothetical protein